MVMTVILRLSRIASKPMEIDGSLKSLMGLSAKYSVELEVFLARSRMYDDYQMNLLEVSRSQIAHSVAISN